MKNIYKVTSYKRNWLFFVCSEMTAEEVKEAYLTELNMKLYPTDDYHVDLSSLYDVNSPRYKGQPLYAVEKDYNNTSSLYAYHLIRNGLEINRPITEKDLY